MFEALVTTRVPAAALVSSRNANRLAPCRRQTSNGERANKVSSGGGGGKTRGADYGQRDGLQNAEGPSPCWPRCGIDQAPSTSNVGTLGEQADGKRPSELRGVGVGRRVRGCEAWPSQSSRARMSRAERSGRWLGGLALGLRRGRRAVEKCGVCRNAVSPSTPRRGQCGALAQCLRQDRSVR